MAIEWRLREALEASGIFNASQLEAALRETLGISISRTALDKLIKQQPALIRLETIQYLSTLLQLSSERLISVTPEAVICNPHTLKPFVQKTNLIEPLMVDPGE